MVSLLGNTRRPDISFYRDGRIDITSRVARSLELCDGDVIDVMKHKSEFYLYVRYRNYEILGKHEAQCHSTKRHSNHFRAHSVRLCSAILRECDTSHAALLPAGETVILDGIGPAITLITHSILSINDPGNKI